MNKKRMLMVAADNAIAQSTNGILSLRGCYDENGDLIPFHQTPIEVDGLLWEIASIIDKHCKGDEGAEIVRNILGDLTWNSVIIDRVKSSLTDMDDDQVDAATRDSLWKMSSSVCSQAELDVTPYLDEQIGKRLREEQKDPENPLLMYLAAEISDATLYDSGHDAVENLQRALRNALDDLEVVIGTFVLIDIA